MKRKLWQQGEGGNDRSSKLVEAYTVGEDYSIDNEVLLPYDVQASKAHAKLLLSHKLLTKEEGSMLDKALDEILHLWEKGEFQVERGDEDCHTAIEQHITKHYGDIGKKIHTGRSRNDQSLVMIRLYAKGSISQCMELVTTLGKRLDERSKTGDAKTPMPGYTHMQKAMPTVVSRWLDSYRAGYLDTLEMLRATLLVIDQNPLGSAAGFGVDILPLERDITTKELHFARTQTNPLYCGLSRGLFEGYVLQAMTPVVLLSSRFAVDMMMFTQQETAFFRLPDVFVTGSSIMPQKKNYDIFEIMRANGKVFLSTLSEIQHIVVSLGSGYHRDLQLTKAAFVRGVKLCMDTLELLIDIVPNIQIQEDNLKNSMTPELYATDEVYKLVNNGVPFREAYGVIKAKLAEAP